MRGREFEEEIVALFREAGLPEDGGEQRETIFELVRLYRQGFLRLEEVKARLERIAGLPERSFFD